MIKNLTVVDDATHEAVAIVSERASHWGLSLTQILVTIAIQHGLPHDILADNGKEFLWANHADVGSSAWYAMFLIEPEKPNQNAYTESFNGRFRNECLNRHWFGLHHARVVIKAWRREHNEERPKQGLSALTPSAYGDNTRQSHLWF